MEHYHFYLFPYVLVLKGGFLKLGTSCKVRFSLDRAFNFVSTGLKIVGRSSAGLQVVCM